MDDQKLVLSICPLPIYFDWMFDHRESCYCAMPFRLLILFRRPLKKPSENLPKNCIPITLYPFLKDLIGQLEKETRINFYFKTGY